MAHPDMDALLDEGLKAAIYFLEKNREFFPFGVTMAPDGSISHAQSHTGEEHTPSEEVIERLVCGFRNGAANGDYKCTALVTDVRISRAGETKSDAISVTVEHSDNQPVTCFLPYTNSNGAFEFGEIVAERAERRVFE